jgi:hypothetical protein
MGMDNLRFLYDRSLENEKAYGEYKKEYLNLARYLRTEIEILLMGNLPIEVETFQMLEKKIYSQKMLAAPALDFSICYNVEYTSPAGRNHYQKEERVTKEMIGKLLKIVEKEEEERREQERQKELLKRQKEQEKAEIRALLKSKSKLEQKEEDLMRREQEFQRATQGHIYAASDTPVYFETQRTAVETPKETSAWEKMKQLKNAYENGEITYQEYSQKRKQLL